ncbi:hypothetical protein BSLG_000240 [Batrachochytrium salamandrivorans]|nr:hypothetical protein BSLG_000240 [Batrachochytrium salamandrivorans]
MAETSACPSVGSSPVKVSRVVNRRARAAQAQAQQQQQQQQQQNGQHSVDKQGTTSTASSILQPWTLSKAHITASCIQSRFHVDTLDTLAKEINLTGLTLQLSNGTTLLSNADLLLKPGTHYGLTIRPLLVEQIADTTISDRSILQEVLASDTEICSLLDERDELNRDLASADLTARLRSGRRGWHARQELIKAEKVLADFSCLLENEVALAKALYMEPDVLLDEPTTSREHIQSSIANAVKQGDMGQAMSRKKKLERFGLQRSANGHRFKLNRDMAGYHLSSRNEIVVDRSEEPVEFAIPKSTAIVNGGTAIQSGTISRHPNLKIGYFAQSHVDSLH